MQLQMSYDDFDGSLNVHVIRAKNIQPIRKGNTADAFVKVVMLPFKKLVKTWWLITRVINND